MENNGWHTEKHELCNFLKDRVLEGRVNITYGELLHKNLPGFFRSFLKSQVKRYFDQENPVRIEKNARYDLHTEEIQQELGQLRENIQRGTIFTADEISDAIDKTIRLQIDYFVKPRTTLERVFFRAKESRSQKEVLQAILGIADSRKYIQQIIKALKTNSSATITKSQFILLDQQVEADVYQQDAIAVFLQDISVLLDFLGIIQNQVVQQLKLKLLPEMLTERNLNGLAERVNTQRNFSPDALLSLKEIESLLKDVPDFEKPKELNFQEGKRNESPSSDWQEDIFGDTDSDAHPFLNLSDKIDPPVENDEKNREVSGNRVFFGSGRSQTIGAREIGSLNQNEREAPEKKKPRIIYKGEEKSYPKKSGLHGRHPDDSENMVIDRKMIENQPNGPIPSLSAIIDSRSRKILIRKVFKKDEIAYNAFIEKMEATLTWKEAKVMIDEEMFKRNIEPFSREAIRLGDLIFSRYFPKKQ